MKYFVSASAGRGGDGSKERPFQTITEAAKLAVDMLYSLDETIQTGKELNRRFDRTFE